MISWWFRRSKAPKPTPPAPVPAPATGSLTPLDVPERLTVPCARLPYGDVDEDGRVLHCLAQATVWPYGGGADLYLACGEALQTISVSWRDLDAITACAARLRPPAATEPEPS